MFRFKNFPKICKKTERTLFFYLLLQKWYVTPKAFCVSTFLFLISDETRFNDMMEVDRNGSPANDKMEDDDSENEESGNPLAKSDSWDDQV